MELKKQPYKFGTLSKTISNTNELLGNYEGIYGVKTGFTFNAGRCLVTSCKKNNLDIILVVLGADTKKNRTLDSVKILNYIFNNYTKIDISNILYEEFYKFENIFTHNVIVEKSTDKPIIELSNVNNTILPLQKDELNSITSEVYSLNKIIAPTTANTKIGEINIKINNEIIFSSNIILKNTLTRKNWKLYYKELFKNYLNIMYK